MGAELHTYNYVLKDGRTKMYGYRFEIASIENKRKWINKRGFKTKAEAIKAGNEAINHYNDVGEAIQPSDISFSDFLDYWIEHDCKVDLSQNTIKNYEKKARLYIKPYLGGYRLKTIKKDDLQGLIFLLYDKGISTNTLSVIKGILTKCFNFAVDRQFLRYSPAVRLKTPRNRSPETPSNYKPHIYIPKERMDEIFERFPEGTPSHIPLMIGYRCGLRLGEAYALLWDDIDLDSKTLTVSRQVQWHQDDLRTSEEKQ